MTSQPRARYPKPHPCKCGCGRTAWGQRKYADGCAWYTANAGRLRAAMLDKDKLALDVGGLQVKPRLLDLFCGAGGAARGYQMAGFYVVGVDIKRQPHYVGDEFYQADAMTYPLEGFDAIHASPPCQRYSHATIVHGGGVQSAHPDLVVPLRERLIAAGVPYVIENVPGAPLENVLFLCGSMFGLEVRRHRLFEGSVPWLRPCCNHSHKAVPVYGHTEAGANRGRERGRGRTNGVADWQRAMGIDWMTVSELSQAIPPAYAEYIGRALMQVLRGSPVRRLPAREIDEWA